MTTPATLRSTLVRALAAGFGHPGRPAVPTPALAAARPAAAGFARPSAARRMSYALDRHGWLAAGAHLGAVTLARLADAARRRAGLWSLRRQRRLTERALRGLDAHTLRDLGIDASEVASVAREAAGTIAATRERVWREIGHRIG